MRFTRWCVMVGVLLLTVSGSSLALVSQDTAEYHILSLELMGPEETGPLAHFFIEPETGAWGVAGDWTYWEPEGGWYLRRDAEGIYRTWLLTGQEEKITNLPEDTVVLRAAVSPDGQWVAFAANIPPQNLTVYAVRSDGSEQRLLMHVGYTVRIWAFGWSEDGRSVEFKVQPNNLKVANVSVRLDRSAVTADNWYYISPDSRWIAWKTPNQYLYVMNLDTGETRQLPDMVAEAPLWSPDGRWLLYIVGRVQKYLPPTP
jgi:Tol biopolymer transport system component